MRGCSRFCISATWRDQTQPRDGELVLRPVRSSLQAPLIDILGEPLKPSSSGIPTRCCASRTSTPPDTKDRLDKAAATQLVFEDAMIHVVDHLLRATGAQPAGADRRRGAERGRQHAAARAFRRGVVSPSAAAQGALHLWVPPVPGDPGVTIGAAWLFAHLAGAPRGAPMTHAFYCGRRRRSETSRRACSRRHRLATHRRHLDAEGRDAIADLMAFMVAQNGVIALYQGAAETGRARSAIARSSPIPAIAQRASGSTSASNTARRSARWRRWRRWRRQQYFELHDGASDAGYNAYNYMVLTAHSKPRAREKFRP
jgi:carbamoyltransferase